MNCFHKYFPGSAPYQPRSAPTNPPPFLPSFLKARLEGQARISRPQPAERPTGKHAGDPAAALENFTFAQNTKGQSNLPLLSRL